jgi:hypothetical protein
MMAVGLDGMGNAMAIMGSVVAGCGQFR